jgi:hypothetical protein
MWTVCRFLLIVQKLRRGLFGMLSCERASGRGNEILEGKTLTITRVGNDGTAKLKSDTPFS